MMRAALTCPPARNSTTRDAIASSKRIEDPSPHSMFDAVCIPFMLGLPSGSPALGVSDGDRTHDSRSHRPALARGSASKRRPDRHDDARNHGQRDADDRELVQAEAQHRGIVSAPASPWSSPPSPAPLLPNPDGESQAHQCPEAVGYRLEEGLAGCSVEDGGGREEHENHRANARTCSALDARVELAPPRRSSKHAPSVAAGGLA